MNIFVRGVDSYKGYQTKILNKTWEKVDCDKCVIISRNNDGSDHYSDGKYVEIPFEKANRHKNIKLKNMYAVPEEILTGMKPYESRIFETMMREYVIPVFTFEECKEILFSEVVYWYNLIEKYKVDCMIFHNAPHMTHDYIIYCLGCILKIPMLLFMPSFFPGRLEWGEQYEDLGRSVGRKYDELLTTRREVILPKDLEAVYQRYRNGFERQQFEKINSNFRNMYEKVKHTVTFVERRNIYVRRQQLLSRMMKATSISEKKKCCKEYKKDIEFTKRCQNYIKNAIIPTEYLKYDKYTKKGGEPYIYFGLQCAPESSLMPRLPVFYDQKYMICILAEATKKCGLKLYVKEHWNQSIREKYLYEIIYKYPNIRLFGPDESNIKLISNSIAVSTGTGSCIMEGMFNNVPALTFGDGYWTGAPGVFRVHDVESCCEAINAIVERKYVITDENIKLFLLAVADETIPMNLYQTMKFGSPFTDQESIDNISEFIIKWLLKVERDKKNEKGASLV